MDYGVFDSLAGSPGQAQTDIVVQVAEIINPNSLMLWDGYKKIVGVANMSGGCGLGGLTFATITLKQYKVFGRERLIISVFEVFASGEENGQKLLTRDPALEKAGLANLRTGKNRSYDFDNLIHEDTGRFLLHHSLFRTVQGVVLSVDKTYSNPDDPLGNKRFRKIMLADHTGSVNVTAWRECVEIFNGTCVGDFVKITNVNLEQNEKYQQAATCKIGVTLSGSSTVTRQNTILEIPQRRLKPLRSVTGTNCVSGLFDLFGIVEDVERFNSVNKTWVLKLLDPTVDPQPCAVTLSGNLAGRFSMDYKYKLVILCNLQMPSEGHIQGKDAQSFYYICMQRTKETAPTVDWAITNGYISSGEIEVSSPIATLMQAGSTPTKRSYSESGDDEGDEDPKRKHDG